MSSLDSSRPYVMRAMEPFELISFSIPKVMLRTHADVVCKRTAVRIPGDSTSRASCRRSSAGSSTGSTTVRSPSTTTTSARASSGCCGPWRPTAPATGQAIPSTALRPRIKAWIEGHLDDPGLGPESIAAAHYISVRYLHKLFEPEGVSVSEWVRQKRLDHCSATSSTPRSPTRRS